MFGDAAKAFAPILDACRRQLLKDTDVRIKPLMLITLLALAGCDHDANDQAALRARLSKAVEQVKQANSGYVPKGLETVSTVAVGTEQIEVQKADLEAYKQKALTAAAGDLEGLIDKGPDTQRVAARRLLAEVRTSQAHHLEKQALANWAQLSNQEATLLGHVTAVNLADARGKLYDTDPTPLLLKLKKEKATLEQQIRGMRSDAQELGGRIQQDSEQIDALNASATEFMAKTQDLRSQAFTLKTNQSYDLYDQADELDRRGQIDSTRSQELAVKRSIDQRELALIHKKIDSLSQAARVIDGQLDIIGRRPDKELHSRAISDRARATDEMTLLYDRVIEAFNQDIQTVFLEADLRAAEAVNLLETAARVADPTVRKQVQIEWLSRLTSRVHLITQHILAASSHGQILATLAKQTNQLVPRRSAVMADNALRIRQHQQKLITQARELISQALAIAQEQSKTAELGDPVTTLLTQQQKQLQDYNRRIDRLRRGDS